MRANRPSRAGIVATVILTFGSLVSTTAAASPAPPATPTITGIAARAAAIEIRFAPNVDHGSPVQHFDATCTSTDGGSVATAPGFGTPYGDARRALVVAGASSGHAYTCTLAATSAGEEDIARIRAGYDGEAATAVMDKLAAQEAEAAAAAAAARDAAKADKHGHGGGGGFSLGNIMGAVNNAMNGNWTDVAIFAFDSYVDNRSEEAVSHHPAPERLKLLSNYAYKQYRDTLPAAPTPLPWGAKTR